MFTFGNLKPNDAFVIIPLMHEEVRTVHACVKVDDKNYRLASSTEAVPIRPEQPVWKISRESIGNCIA